MWSEVQSLRHNFANEIRRKQHKQYFELHRQPNHQNLPALVYIPILIENQLYDDIQNVLDYVQISPGDEFNQSVVDKIKIRWQHHSSMKIRQLMFRLMNRLNLWGITQAQKALQLFSEGEDSMLKQLAMYFDRKNRQLASLVYSDSKQYEQKVRESKQILSGQLLSLSQKLATLTLKSDEYRLYWLDLICTIIEHYSQQQLPAVLTTSQTLIDAIQCGLESSNQFQLIRIMKIISTICSLPQLQVKLVTMECFGKFIDFIKQGSIDVVIEGLQILAGLLCGQQSIAHKLVQNYNIMSIYNKYIDHVMLQVQSKVLWGISNIAGSDQYSIILTDPPLLTRLLAKTTPTTHPSLRIEAYYCLLNLCCNSNPQQLQQLHSQYKITQVLCTIVQHLLQPAYRDALFQRALYALYHMIGTYPQSVVELQAGGCARRLGQLEQGEQGDRARMLGIVMEGLEGDGTGEATNQ